MIRLLMLENDTRNNQRNRIKLLLLKKIATLLSVITCIAATALHNGFAHAESLSITLKPNRGITGTRAINFHEDGKITYLVYDSPTKITEMPLSMDKKERAALISRAKLTLDEVLRMQEFSQLSEYKLLLGIAITKDTVTKSISTRRFTKRIERFVSDLKNYVPGGFNFAVQKQ